VSHILSEKRDIRLFLDFGLGLHHQHARSGLTQDAFGHAPQKLAVLARLFFGAHDDNVRFVLVGVLDDNFVGLSTEDRRLNLDACLACLVRDLADRRVTLVFERPDYLSRGTSPASARTSTVASSTDI